MRKQTFKKQIFMVRGVFVHVPTVLVYIEFFHMIGVQVKFFFPMNLVMIYFISGSGHHPCLKFIWSILKIILITA